MPESPSSQPEVQPRRMGRSVVAVLVAFLATGFISLITDQVLHMLNVYPPWGQPMYEPGLNVLALSYRLIYTILGGWLAAKMAPNNPMRHAVWLGIVGLVPATAGAIVSIPMNLGPAWYPISLVVTAVPCTWFGGYLFLRQSSGKS